MLTKEDKKWIEGKLVKENKPMRDSIDLLRRKMTDMNFEKFNFDSRLNSIEASNIRTEEKVDKMLVQLDKFTGNIANLDQENKFGAVTLRRHDIQIHELATATSTTISE